MITWWNDKDIEVVEIDNRYIALYGWNGEAYTDCWEVEEIKNNIAFGVKANNICVKPLYEQIDEDDYDIVVYEIV